MDIVGIIKLENNNKFYYLENMDLSQEFSVNQLTINDIKLQGEKLIVIVIDSRITFYSFNDKNRILIRLL